MKEIRKVVQKLLHEQMYAGGGRDSSGVQSATKT